MNKTVLKQTLDCISFDYSASEAEIFLNGYLHATPEQNLYDLLTSSDRKQTIAQAHVNQNFKIFDETFKSAMAYIWILGKAMEDNDKKPIKLDDYSLIARVNQTLYHSPLSNATYEELAAKQSDTDILLYNMVFKMAVDFTHMVKSDQVETLDDLQHCVCTIKGTEQTLQK